MIAHEDMLVLGLRRRNRRPHRQRTVQLSTPPSAASPRSTPGSVTTRNSKTKSCRKWKIWWPKPNASSVTKNDAALHFFYSYWSILTWRNVPSPLLIDDPSALK